MAFPYPDGDREKVASKLTPALQQELKIRCAELSLDIQDAVTTAITNWCASTLPGPDVDTAGAKSFSTWLPPGMYDEFKGTCGDRSLSYIQGRLCCAIGCMSVAVEGRSLLRSLSCRVAAGGDVMSLQVKGLPEIPEETVRVARSSVFGVSTRSADARCSRNPSVSNRLQHHLFCGVAARHSETVNHSPSG